VRVCIHKLTVAGAASGEALYTHTRSFVWVTISISIFFERQIKSTFSISLFSLLLSLSCVLRVCLFVHETTCRWTYSGTHNTKCLRYNPFVLSLCLYTSYILLFTLVSLCVCVLYSLIIGWVTTTTAAGVVFDAVICATARVSQKQFVFGWCTANSWRLFSLVSIDGATFCTCWFYIVCAAQ
jgi:hypothetical protein